MCVCEKGGDDDDVFVMTTHDDHQPHILVLCAHELCVACSSGAGKSILACPLPELLVVTQVPPVPAHTLHTSHVHDGQVQKHMMQHLIWQERLNECEFHLVWLRWGLGGKTCVGLLLFEMWRDCRCSSTHLVVFFSCQGCLESHVVQRKPRTVWIEQRWQVLHSHAG